VPEVAALAAQAGLTVSALMAPARYDPATYLDDKDLLKRARKLPWLEACALAENLSGAIKAHIVYLTKGTPRENAVAAIADEAVPLLLRTDAKALATSLAQRPEIKTTLDGVPVTYPVDADAARIVGLIDGIVSIGALRDACGLKNFDRQFRTLYRALNNLNLMLLRHPAAP